MKKDQLKMRLTDDEREFILGLLDQEKAGLNKIKEFSGEFKEEFYLIKSITKKLGIFTI